MMRGSVSPVVGETGAGVWIHALRRPAVFVMTLIFKVCEVSLLKRTLPETSCLCRRCLRCAQHTHHSPPESASVTVWPP